MVEAQHVASTMKLVDTAVEQALLESLIEQSKPPLPAQTESLDYLLATPFRYGPPPPHGTRFRAITDPGVFYGAGSVRTACAEFGFWRWKFLMDAVELNELGPVPHTAFRAAIDTTAIDLREPPYSEKAALWTHPADYSATQGFAREARQAGIGAIIYRSVRDTHPGWCVAVLTPTAFAKPKPLPGEQTWILVVRRERVIWFRGGESLEFVAGEWL